MFAAQAHLVPAKRPLSYASQAMFAPSMLTPAPVIVISSDEEEPRAADDDDVDNADVDNADNSVDNGVTVISLSSSPVSSPSRSPSPVKRRRKTRSDKGLPRKSKAARVAVATAGVVGGGTDSPTVAVSPTHAKKSKKPAAASSDADAAVDDSPPPNPMLSPAVNVSRRRTESAVLVDENGQFSWVCSGCTLNNPIQVPKCTVCGSHQTRVVQVAARAARAKLSAQSSLSVAERIAAAQAEALRMSIVIEPIIHEKFFPEQAFAKARNGSSSKRMRYVSTVQQPMASQSPIATPDKPMSQRSNAVRVGTDHQAKLPAMLSDDEKRAERALLLDGGSGGDMRTPGPRRMRGGVCVWSGANAAAAPAQVHAVLREVRTMARPLFLGAQAVAAGDTALAVAHDSGYDVSQTTARLQSLLRVPMAPFRRVRWFYQVSSSEWRAFAPLQCALLERNRSASGRVWRERADGTMLLPRVDPNSRPPFFASDRVFVVDYDAQTCVIGTSAQGRISSMPTPSIDSSVPLANRDFVWLDDDASELLRSRSLLESCTSPQCAVARNPSDRSTFVVHAPLCAAGEDGARCAAPQTPMLSDCLRIVKRVSVADLMPASGNCDELWDPIERMLFEALVLTPSVPRNGFSSTSDECGIEFGRVAAAITTKRAPAVIQFFVDWSQTEAFVAFLARNESAAFTTEAHRQIDVPTNDYEYEPLMIADVFSDSVRSLRGGRHLNSANNNSSSLSSGRRGAARHGNRLDESVTVASVAVTTATANAGVVVADADDAVVSPLDAEAEILDDVQQLQRQGQQAPQQRSPPPAQERQKTPQIVVPPSDDVTSESAWVSGEPFRLSSRFDERSLRDCALLCAGVVSRAPRDGELHQRVLAALLSVTPTALGSSARLGKRASLPSGVTLSDVALRTRGIYVAASAAADDDELELVTDDDATLNRLLRQLLIQHNVAIVDEEDELEQRIRRRQLQVQ